MIKTELEWHSNDRVPNYDGVSDIYLIALINGGDLVVSAVFDGGGKFVYFLDNTGTDWSINEVIGWVKFKPLPSLVEDLSSDLITDCLCGDTTPHEPWWEDCGLGKSEEHMRLASPAEEERMTRLIEEMRETKLALDKLEEEPEDSFLVANMAQCVLCKDIIESHSRHDFVTCSCSAISCDGGLGYLRRIGEPKNIIELSVCSTDDYETIRTHLKRGSRGVNRDEPFTWIPLKSMTTDHLKATIEYEDPNNKFIPLYEQELKYRGEWE